MLSKDIVFEPDRHLLDLVSMSTIGHLRQVDKMNIIKNASDTSLKCVSQSRQERTWSISSSHSSISNNSFYSSTQSLCGTTEGKIMNFVHMIHYFLPHRNTHFSKKSDSKTPSASNILARELPHMSQFVSFNHLANTSPCVIPDIAILENMCIITGSLPQ
ncbi:hypothetical protein DPMN_060881 [Dreissena polymorpha]|uniref:Uncharacterized protein n=1 Tax=Dreissena polymorpha TaxID=45954 RepID=A0A9D4HGJ2_DREPO|nr:hypothetical protein DPMN_060881 [Dreissena polymorpha]